MSVERERERSRRRRERERARESVCVCMYVCVFLSLKLLTTGRGGENYDAEVIDPNGNVVPCKVQGAFLDLRFFAVFGFFVVFFELWARVTFASWNIGCDGCAV